MSLSCELIITFSKFLSKETDSRLITTWPRMDHGIIETYFKRRKLLIIKDARAFIAIFRDEENEDSDE